MSLVHYAKRAKPRLTVAEEGTAHIGVLQDLVVDVGKATFAPTAQHILIKENVQLVIFVLKYQ